MHSKYMDISQLEIIRNSVGSIDYLWYKERELKHALVEELAEHIEISIENKLNGDKRMYATFISPHTKVIRLPDSHSAFNVLLCEENSRLLKENKYYKEEVNNLASKNKSLIYKNEMYSLF